MCQKRSPKVCLVVFCYLWRCQNSTRVLSTKTNTEQLSLCPKFLICRNKILVVALSSYTITANGLRLGAGVIQVFSETKLLWAASTIGGTKIQKCSDETNSARSAPLNRSCTPKSCLSRWRLAVVSGSAFRGAFSKSISMTDEELFCLYARSLY